MRKLTAILVAALFAACGAAQAQPAAPAKIIIDTHIGDDIDDGLSGALGPFRPGLPLLGFSASFGDTPTRAKMLDRMLGELGKSSIPVTQGIQANVNLNAFTQRRYA